MEKIDSIIGANKISENISKNSNEILRKKKNK